jgi:MFS family permease
MRFRGPLADRYLAAVVLVLLALTPYLVLTTASAPLEQLIGKDLGMTPRALGVTTGMANAAYAVGAVLAVQFASRLRPRRMLVLYAALFVVGSVLAAWSPTAGCFIAGHVVQGLTTGLMLIASVPPLVLNWGKDKLRHTAVVMNLGIFGAVALGPTIGGLVASTGTWRPLFWASAALGAGTLAFALLTFEDAGPQDPSAPVDVPALALSAAGCALAFLGVSELMGRTLGDVVVWLPLASGLALLALVIVREARLGNPLIPIRMLAHTVPIGAILTAMTAGASSVALVELTQSALRSRGISPAHAGLLFLPEFGLALVVAFLFGWLFFTRWTTVLVFSGLAMLTAGGVVLTLAVSGSTALVAVGAGLVGFGVGASVSPALFLAGFSLPNGQLPRVFAFVELLRGVAAFLVAPVLAHLALTVARPIADGTRTAMLVATGIAFAGLLAALAIFRLGRQLLHAPDIDRWLGGEGPAIPSAPFGAVFRDVESGDESGRGRRFSREAARGRGQRLSSRR